MFGRVAELAYARDLKSRVRKGRAGSSPASAIQYEKTYVVRRDSLFLFEAPSSTFFSQKSLLFSFEFGII